MVIPITQWEAVGGVAHAWIAQCEGYVSLCGREVSGLQGQRSGIRCAQCTTAVGWAEQTGQESYLTPQAPMEATFAPMVHVHEPPRVIHRRQRPQPIRQAPVVLPVLEPSISEPPVPLAVPRDEPPMVVAGGLSQPDSMEAYQELPVSEQRYWAPLMLARAGQDAVWDQGQETAGQFQERCYEQLRTSTRRPER